MKFVNSKMTPQNTETLFSLIQQFDENHRVDSVERRAFLKAVRIVLGLEKMTKLKRNLRRYRATYRNQLVVAYVEAITSVTKCEKFSAQIGLNINHTFKIGDYDSIIDMICDKFNLISSAINWKTLIVSFVLCLTNVWYNFDRPATVLMSISQFLMTLKLNDTIMQEALEWFKTTYVSLTYIVSDLKSKCKTRFSCQVKLDELSYTDASKLIPTLGCIISVILSLGVMRCMPKGDSFDTSFNRFSKISGVIRSLQDVSRIGGDFVTACIDQFAFMVFGVERPKLDEWKNINVWNDEVVSLMVPDFENTIKGNEQLKNRVESLLQQGLNIVRTLDMLKVPVAERQHITQSIMFLTRARETAGNCGAGQTKPRVAPAIIHICGNSGVGKSTVLWALISEIQASLGVTKASDLHEKTYFRRPGGKFWDGYNSGMNVVVCDDFGAMIDSSSKPNEEFLEAIHMSNTAFWQLNMAELSEKRNTFFQAKCVLWTSNKSHFAVKSLTNPEAVLRRVDLKIRQKPKPEFSKTDMQNGISVEILDNKKVNEAIKKDPTAMLDCVLFDIIDKNDPNDSVIEADLGFWDVAERCVILTQKSINYFEDFNTVLATHVEDAILRCADGTWKKPARITGQIKMEPTLWNYFGYDYQHCDLVEGMKKAVIEEVSLGDMTDEEYEACKLIVVPDCLFIETSRHQPILNAYHSAESAWTYLDPAEKTEETFINLYVQACKKNGKILSISEQDICASHFAKLKQRLSIVREHIEAKHSALVHYVESQYAISPRTFYVLTGVVSAVMAVGAYKLYSYLFSTVEKFQKETYDTEKTKALIRARVESHYDQNTKGRVNGPSVENYDVSTTKAKKNHTVENYSTNVTKGRNGVQLEGINAQAVVDQNAAEVVNVVYKNMYKLECKENGEWSHMLNLTVIKGRLAIINKHVLIKRHVTEWRIRNSSFPQGIEFNLMSCAMATVEDDESSVYAKRDVMMIELPRVVHTHRDISSKFMTGDDFSRFNTLKQISAIGYIPDSEISVRQYFGNDVAAVDTEFEVDDGRDNVILKVRRVFKYNIQTTSGDCGAVLVAFDKDFSNKIFGIHCGGTVAARWTGFGTPVTKAFLNVLEARITPKFDESRMSPEIQTHSDMLDLTCSEQPDGSMSWFAHLPFIGNFYQIGKDATRIHANVNTRIFESPVHGLIQEPTMAPAKLAPFVNAQGVRVDPMVNARAKASPIAAPLDRDILTSCVRDFIQMIDSGDEDAQLLTYEEAIAGKEGDDCYPPMKRSTSPGYGWDKKGKGKTAWLGDGEYDFTNPMLRSAYDNLLAKCRKGIRPSTIWTDTLKDERRTLDKVQAGKTRLFSCGEMAYTVLFRQYFAGYIAHMTRNKIDFESCVGVNVYSRDWSYLVDHLTQTGNKVLAGDFSNYDGTLHPEMLWECLELINAWYQGSEEDNLVRRALWCEIVNSIHISGNVFYMWNHSQPSGCPMTTILNCTYHSLSARYVYILCAMKYAKEMTPLTHFHKYVRHVNYGDDDVWCISNSIIDWFNQVTITEAYLALGMTYTDEAKTGNIVPYRSLDEINFLKRSFRFDTVQQRWRAPLALETIREMPMWIHGKVDTYELTASNLEQAVRELAQHPKEVFDRELPPFEVARKVVSKKYPVYFLTYEAYQLDEFNKLI